MLCRVQCDKEVEIKEKLKLIVIEKNRLRLLGQKGPTPQPVKEPAKLPQLAKNETVPNIVTSSKVIQSIPKPTPINTAAQMVEGVKVQVAKVEAVKTLTKPEAEKITTSNNSVVEHSEATKTEQIETKAEPTQEIPAKMDVDVVVSRFHYKVNLKCSNCPHFI